MRLSWSAVCGLWLLAGCSDVLVLQLQTGPQAFDVSADGLAIPDALRGADGQIASVPCGPMGVCPTDAAVPITCEAGFCDPAPRTLSFPLGDVVDFDVLASGGRVLLRHIDAIEIVEGAYSVSVNSMTVPLPETELFWGPEGASDVDPAMGVVRIGTVPSIAAMTTVDGQLALDAAGVSLLSDYLVNTSRRIRFFARTQVDLEPGQPVPAGALSASVNLRVRITGTVLR